jgi:hypothetical protein
LMALMVGRWQSKAWCPFNRWGKGKEEWAPG